LLLSYNSKIFAVRITKDGNIQAKEKTSGLAVIFDHHEIFFIV